MFEHFVLYICTTQYNHTIYKYMVLTQTAIQKISTPRIRIALAAALNFTEQWIIKSIEANKDNGPLTTVKAVQVIVDRTGMDPNEVLEEITEKESVR